MLYFNSKTNDCHSKTADSDTVSTYQVSSVQLVTDKKLEAFNNGSNIRQFCAENPENP